MTDQYKLNTRIIKDRGNLKDQSFRMQNPIKILIN